MIFDYPKDQASIIKVIGVGGGGCNAVNHMHKQGIKDVNFVICNTDQQALDISSVPNKIQLGPSLTKGRGAGSHPSVGQQATMESLQEIKSLLEKNTEMVFITAGMGGGTGTGGAPVIAKLAKEMGILMIGIVTLPFGFEGKRRKSQAHEGLETLKHFVDAIVVISNDKLREMFGNLVWQEAFAKADDILTYAAKGIAEIITVPGYVNVDFEDVKTVLRDSGLAIMGSGIAECENRAQHAVENALSSPLLNDNDISGARSILINITSGNKPVLMDEIAEITDYVQEAAGNDCDIIWGNCNDENLGDKLMVTVIATGFETTEQRNHRLKQSTYKITHIDTNEMMGKKEMIVQPDAQVDVDETDEEAKIKLKYVPKITEEKKTIVKEEEKNPQQFTFDFGLFDFPVEPKLPESKIEEPTLNEIVENKIDENTSIIEPSISEAIAEKTEEEIVEQTDEFIMEEKTEIIIEIKSESHEIKEDITYEKKEEKTIYQHTENKSFITNDDKMHVVQNSNDERNKRLKNMSLKLNGGNLEEIEKVPAYMRRNVDLEETPVSKEINVSKYNVVGSDNGAEIKKNNSFLHDNVD